MVGRTMLVIGTFGGRPRQSPTKVQVERGSRGRTLPRRGAWAERDFPRYRYLGTPGDLSSRKMILREEMCGAGATVRVRVRVRDLIMLPCGCQGCSRHDLLEGFAIKGNRLPHGSASVLRYSYS